MCFGVWVGGQRRLFSWGFTDIVALQAVMLRILLLTAAAVWCVCVCSYCHVQKVEASPGDLKCTDAKAMCQTFKAAFGVHE